MLKGLKDIVFPVLFIYFQSNHLDGFKLPYYDQKV